MNTANPMTGGGATVVAMAEARAAGAEAQDWSAFAGASASSSQQADDTQDQATLVAFCGSWLALAARQAPRARQALLLLAETPGTPYRAVAAWPDPRRDMRSMGPAAERSLREACGLATDIHGGSPRAGAPARLAYPVAGKGRPWAVVVLDMADGSAAAVQEGLRSLHWASGWLLSHLQSRQQALQARVLKRSKVLNELSALALQSPTLEASALAVANRLARQFGCSRVGVGFDKDGSVQPLVLSHSAHFDPRSDTARHLAEAMDEAADLGQPLAAVAGLRERARSSGTAALAPSQTAPAGIQPDSSAAPTREPDLATPGDDEPPFNAQALVQAAVARQLQVAALASVPITQGPITLGAITLERMDGPAFSPAELAALQRIATWVAPVWALQQARQRPLKQVLRERLQAATPALRRPGTVLVAGTVGLALLASLVVPLPHRVSARTTLEGISQRAVLAPFDGYLAEALVRAGDTVRAGQPLARLDDSDQKLEVARWTAEREQQQRRWQIAMAAGDRANAGVATAQIAQSDAMLALAQERLARATIVAPHDAVVVSGDWQNQVGAAVENGRTLFELAPPQGHRVVMRVNDSDIARLQPGQRGELVLASLPQQAWGFTVSTVMPVATAAEGLNLFRVEGALDARDPRLRPGMEGVAKVQVGERSALWVATHNLVNWLRLAFWSWLP